MRLRLEDCSPELKRRIEDAIRKQDAGNNATVPDAESMSKTKPSKSYDKDVVTDFLIERGLPPPSFEYRFHPDRKWRLDLAWPAQKLCLEVQGGIFIAGRHTRGAALLKEWEKLNTLAVMGWRVLFCQPSDLMKDETVGYIKDSLATRS